MWFFLHCIQSYTGRQLTNPDDVFAAFSGAIQLLELYMNTDIVFGIPTSHFDLALLWTPVGRVTRRGKRRCQQMGSVCIKDPTGTCTCPLVTDITGGQSIPTWSWAGWTGEKIDYRHESLSGCLGDVHHWLTYRTWIQWYIRDKNGILRPLWKRLQCDGSFAQQRSDVLDEWRGYRCTYEPVSDSTSSTGGRKRPRLSQLVTEGYPEVRRTSNQQYIIRARDTSYAYSPAPTIQHGAKSLSQYSSPTAVTKQDSMSHYGGNTPRDYPVHPFPVNQATGSRHLLRTPPQPPESLYRLQDCRPAKNTRVPRWDRYCRWISSDVPNEEDHDFGSITQDHPFGVITNDATRISWEDAQSYMPILQFFTWSTELHVATRESEAGVSSGLSSAICRCDIADKNGDWCGSL